ncbi:MAG TPA: PF20097 family protein [Pyrinomonadaceae bacterium]|nr:PF20097 family protein [Pyrinomonadaceae bacterium]
MSESILSCPKCKGVMNDGFIADVGYGTIQPSRWVKGEPVKSFWTGTKVSDKEKYAVKTYRCTNCGYIESYANEQVD